MGCLLDLEHGVVSFSKNGRSLGTAFKLSDRLPKDQPLFPAVCLKNAELHLNFGQQPFLHQPRQASGAAVAPREWTSSGALMRVILLACSQGVDHKFLCLFAVHSKLNIV